MLGSALGGPGSGKATPTRSAARDAVGGLAAVLALGLVLRLIIAYVLPGSGFGVDVGAFQYWAQNLASQGLNGFYERPFFHDYTPGYLYVLFVLGKVGQVIGAPGLGDLVKLPAIAADLLLGWLVWSMVRELGGGVRAARVAALLAVLNPVTWFDSTIWGQVDSVGVVVLLLALRELWRDRPERAAVLAMLAALVKPQLGILIPIVAVVTIRRALRPEGAFGGGSALGAGDGGTEGTGGTSRWERATQGPIRILTTGLAGLVTAIVVSLPFGLSIPGLIRQIFATAGGYPYVSVNAFNPWALVSAGGRGVALNGTWACDGIIRPSAGVQIDLGGFVLFSSPASTVTCDGAMFGPIPALVVGTALFLAALAAVLVVVWRRPDPRTLLVSLAVLAVAFFVLPTRVHERYLFPFMAIGAILAGASRPWRIALAASSVAMLANLYAILMNPFYKNPGIADWFGIQPLLASFPAVALAAAVQAAVLVWALAELRAPAVAALADEIEDSALDDDEAWVHEVPARPVPPAAAPAPAAASVAAASLAPAASAMTPAAAPAAADASPAAASGGAPIASRLVPAWLVRGTSAELGPVAWFRERFADRPVRPDRSRELDREGGGRLDRLDVWILAVLVVSLFTVRIWRLSEPVQMHFDEVYHPRTATEFLQDWRYGMSHDIYEWTHPHLAKYAMALGIIAFGEDRVDATSDLGVPVADAAIEPRWDNGTGYTVLGDRLWVATGTEVRAYDLGTRQLVARVAVQGARAIAVDTLQHRVFVGADDGMIRTISTRPLDARSATVVTDMGAASWMSIGTPIRSLFLPAAGTALLAVTTPADAAQGTADLAILDAGAASETTRFALRGVGQMSDAGAGTVAIATADGVAMVDVTNATLSSTVALGGPVLGVTKSSGLTDDPLYASFQGPDGPRIATIVGTKQGDSAGPRLGTSFALPGASAGRLEFDDATRMLHALGTVPGSSKPTVYVIEPHANAVYADAALPGSPAALVLDDQGNYPSADRQQLLALSETGGVATVETGLHAWAWRLPGVVAGVIMCALIYVLARLLFRRRSVALLVGFLTLADGMLFVQSRIGMNDAYVGVFLVAAYVLFAALWLQPGGGRRRWIAFAVGMPVLGLLLGLALASKWVAAYAIGGLGILVLTRSALGRVLLVLGMIVATTFLGYLAISVPNGSGANYLFLAIMVALTLVTVVGSVLHPVAWTWEEQRLGYVAPVAVGAIVAIAGLATDSLTTTRTFGPVAFSPIELAFAAFLGSGAVHAAYLVGARFGFGPLALPPRAGDPAAAVEPAAPAPSGWLRLGEGFGLPAVYALVCLIAIPVAVYVLSYVPWAFVGQNRITDTWPPGHTGQTLLQLTGQMYAYHNNLSTPHPASSPWWAWPLDLKPVWFYQGGFAGGTAAAIYDAGNLVSWWLAIPATAFVAWQAFKRRSAALALIGIGFAAQWLSWARIDRAAFQYHYYTSLPFILLALAYFLAELWHGPSRRTWTLARLAGGLAVLGPMLLWVLDRPLCAFVGVTSVNPGSQACPALIPEMVVTPRALAIALVVGVGALLLVRTLLGRGEDDVDGPAVRDRLGSAAVVAAVATIAFGAVTLLLPNVELFRLRGITTEPIALVALLALSPIAAYVATARDARRFVAGAVGAIGFWFVLWYPNIAALPLPSAFSNTFQGLLPTYLYPFQFPVSKVDRSGPPPALLAPGPLLLMAAIAAVCLAFAWSARSWRIALADEAGAGAGDGEGGEDTRTTGDGGPEGTAAEDGTTA